MYVVTGSSRTGTSLMMQTLKGLGIPVHAPQFVSGEIVKKVGEELYKKNNPHGYYEFAGGAIGNLGEDKFRGSAVKLLGHELFPCPPNLVNKVIICVRDKENAIASLIKASPHTTVTENQMRKNYDTNYLMAESYVEYYTKPFIYIDYKDMIINTEDTINRLIKFLDICVTKECIDVVVNNVEKKNV